jgi:hypothetical protein
MYRGPDPAGWGPGLSAWWGGRIVLHMYELAGWDKAPVAVQGPARWTVDGRLTLSEMARVLLAEQAEQE